MEYRFNNEELKTMCRDLLLNTGMIESIVDSVAETLVEGDLLGHSTHGLKLLQAYLKEIKSGNMATSGNPEILSDNQSSILMDGRYLPGPWLVNSALNIGLSRLDKNPVFTASIRRSHHIACLSAYLKRMTDLGIVCIIMASDPNHRSVAPYGGFTPTYSPNPIAAGIPTSGDPIMIDMSTSSTANGVVALFLDEQKKLPSFWLLDNEGKASDDPKDFFSNPAGSILPLGGLDLGYKGFALGILVEALTSALGGHGRSDGASQWGSSVFIQLIKPDAFGGETAFIKETSYLSDACVNSASMPGKPRVHMPGSSALKKRKDQIKHGVLLSEGIVKTLELLTAEYQVRMPKTVVS